VFGRTVRSGGEARAGWAWLSLIPLGLGAWAPVVLGMRHRRRSWTALGVFWSAVTLAGFILSGSDNQAHSSLAGGLLLLGWAGGIVTSFMIRRQVRRRARSAAVAPADGDSGPMPAATTGSMASVTTGPMPSATTGYAMRAHDVPARRDLWPWVSLVPLGLGSWAPIIAGERCRVWWWWLLGFAGLGACVSGFVLGGSASSPAGAHQTRAGIAYALLFGAWFGGIAVSFGIRSSYEARLGYAVSRPVWPRPSARSLGWSARYALIAFGLTFTAVIVLGLILRYLVGVHVQVGVGVLMVDAILLLALVPLARKRGLSIADLGVQPTLGLRSLGLVAMAFVVYVAVAALWTLAFISRSERNAANILSGVHHPGTFAIVVTVVAIAFSAPIVEEIFFRGLLYRSLRNRLR
jgi:hypothetical protein